ncbi:MAG: hypothetical protein RL181_2416 [Bacteroidota bacterium]
MQYRFWISGALFLWAACFARPSFAQAPRESSDFMDRVWWGGGFALGFSAVNQVTSIQLGVSPMAGYKITNGFSVGPRVSVLASYFSSRFGVVRSNKIAPTYAGGVFARQKLFRDIFAHTEYELENRAYVTPDGSQLLVSRNTNHNYYIGAGYNAGGAEFLILYNLNQGRYFDVSPYVFRFGFTRNF